MKKEQKHRQGLPTHPMLTALAPAQFFTQNKKRWGPAKLQPWPPNRRGTEGGLHSSPQDIRQEEVQLSNTTPLVGQMAAGSRRSQGSMFASPLVTPDVSPPKAALAFWGGGLKGREPCLRRGDTTPSHQGPVTYCGITPCPPHTHHRPSCDQGVQVQKELLLLVTHPTCCFSCRC